MDQSLSTSSQKVDDSRPVLTFGSCHCGTWWHLCPVFWEECPYSRLGPKWYAPDHTFTQRSQTRRMCETASWQYDKPPMTPKPCWDEPAWERRGGSVVSVWSGKIVLWMSWVVKCCNESDYELYLFRIIRSRFLRTWISHICLCHPDLLMTLNMQLVVR